MSLQDSVDDPNLLADRQRSAATVTRRQFLTVVGLAAEAALIAACQVVAPRRSSSIPNRDVLPTTPPAPTRGPVIRTWTESIGNIDGTLTTTAKNQAVTPDHFQKIFSWPASALRQDAREAVGKAFLSQLTRPELPNHAPFLELKTGQRLRVENIMASDGYYNWPVSRSQTPIGNREILVVRLSAGDEDLVIKRLKDLKDVDQSAEVELFWGDLFARGLVLRSEKDLMGEYDPVKLSEQIFIKTAPRRQLTIGRDGKGLSRVRGEVPLYGDIVLNYSVRRNGQTSYKLTKI